MSIEIRNARPDEFEAYIDAIATGLLERPDVSWVAEVVATLCESARTWAASDDRRICGTRLRDATIAACADEHAPGALAKADALLRTADEPWCSTFF